MQVEVNQNAEGIADKGQQLLGDMINGAYEYLGD